MASRFPIRAAIAAALVPLLAIAAFGNQWFSEHVRFETDGPLARRFVNLLGGPFQWRFTPYRGDSGTGVWLAQLLGVIAVVGLTFLFAWVIARRATQSGVFFGVWGATVLASIAAYGLAILASYDAIYDGRQVEPGLNAFWYAVFHSTDGALWGAIVGVVTGGAAVALAGGPARTTRPGTWPIDGQQTVAPPPGVVWGPAVPTPTDAPPTSVTGAPAPPAWGPRHASPPRPADGPGTTPLPPPPPTEP